MAHTRRGTRGSRGSGKRRRNRSKSRPKIKKKAKPLSRKERHELRKERHELWMKAERAKKWKASMSKEKEKLGFSSSTNNDVVKTNYAHFVQGGGCSGK